jgi:TolB-like protein/Flp pilus assembly protein TadD
MAEERLQRRLAAILSADVVGYSRLMGGDEAGTLARLKALRRDLIDPLIAGHSGRTVKLIGDGALVEFGSAVDAVTCAIEIQRRVREHGAGSAETNPIQFRIGINVGDIIIEGEDIYGDGVNIAARLEGIADAGGVAISEDAWRQVQGKVAASFVDSGEHSLKNISRPVRVYRLSLTPNAAAASAAESESESMAQPPTLALPDKPSIAVLPFQNMSGDPEQDFFCDGMVEDILTQLARIKWLFVIGRNSSFAYKGKSPDIRQIGRELGVRYVLEGSVRKVGNRVRITGQLLEAETGSHLWADRYDRTLDDIFVLQDEITMSVVGCLEPQLLAAEHARQRRKPPQSLDAWGCFIRASFLFSQHSEDSSRAALSLLDRAIELDRGYGQAYGLKAYTLVWRVFQGWEDMASAIERATAAATRAIACDSQEPWAYVSRGMVATATRDIAQAVNAYRHAIDLSPNFAYVHAMLGAALALGGMPEESIESTSRAVRLSPRDTFADDFQLFYAFAHFQAGRYVEAAAFAETSIQLRPEHPFPYVMAAACYGFTGNDNKAAGTLAKLKALLPAIAASDVEKTAPYALPEDRARLAQGLRQAGLPD